MTASSAVRLAAARRRGHRCRAPARSRSPCDDDGRPTYQGQPVRCSRSASSTLDAAVPVAPADGPSRCAHSSRCSSSTRTAASTSPDPATSRSRIAWATAIGSTARSASLGAASLTSRRRGRTVGRAAEQLAAPSRHRRRGSTPRAPRSGHRNGGSASRHRARRPARATPRPARSPDRRARRRRPPTRAGRRRRPAPAGPAAAPPRAAGPSSSATPSMSRRRRRRRTAAGWCGRAGSRRRVGCQPSSRCSVAAFSPAMVPSAAGRASRAGTPRAPVGRTASPSRAAALPVGAASAMRSGGRRRGAACEQDAEQPGDGAWSCRCQDRR